VKEGCVRISAGEPTPLQRAAWHRLWTILLAPVESQSTNTEDESAAMLGTTRPSLKPERQRIEVTNDGAS
jgi:hypothetical protein